MKGSPEIVKQLRKRTRQRAGAGDQHIVTPRIGAFGEFGPDDLAETAANPVSNDRCPKRFRHGQADPRDAAIDFAAAARHQE